MFTGHRQLPLLTLMTLLVKSCILIILMGRLTQQVNTVQPVINTVVAPPLGTIIQELRRPLVTMKKKAMS